VNSAHRGSPCRSCSRTRAATHAAGNQRPASSPGYQSLYAAFNCASRVVTGSSIQAVVPPSQDRRTVALGAVSAITPAGRGAFPVDSCRPGRAGVRPCLPFGVPRESGNRPDKCSPCGTQFRTGCGKRPRSRAPHGFQATNAHQSAEEGRPNAMVVPRVSPGCRRTTYALAGTRRGRV
jgi:hypothetical protein